MFLYLLARKDGPIVELHSKAAIYSIEKEKWGERKRETDWESLRKRERQGRDL